MSALKHVLFVDDEADIRTVVKMALEAFGGMQVTVCASGAEALARLAEARPDLILLDVMMPGMDGPTLLARLQGLPGGQPAPVAFLTAKAMPDEVAQLKSLGAIAVIAKPFDPLKLAQQLKELWQLHAPQPAAPTAENGLPVALATELAKLERHFRRELPQRLEYMRGRWQSLRQQHSPELLTEVHRAAHSLVGSAATLRVESVATAARELEKLLKSLLGASEEALISTAESVEAHFLKLAPLAAEAATQAVQPAVAAEVASRAPTDSDAGRADMMASIVFVSALPPAAGLSHQLEGFGYQLHACVDAAQLNLYIERTKPKAIVVDLDASSLDPDRMHMLSECGLPVLALSRCGDFASRLAAVRAGMVSYLCKPFDAVQLAVALDRHALHAPEPPFRVLLIDDEYSVASYHAAILNQEGMMVEQVHSAMVVQDLLEDFAPDVIVTDVYMPDVGGIELARVLRQQERYDHIPIVFLSSERNLDVQQLAVGFGADDFLVKPVVPEHFVAAITNRARRARALRVAMTHDGLTGLLNHKSAKALLEQELACAQRTDRPMALVLIDVDHFKRVNDLHGHLAGDSVLAALARLLRQRLRRGDHVCRYGGEEFLLILPEATAPTALAVADGLRQSFAQLHFNSQGGDFSVAFSAGVAVSHAQDTAEALLHAADTALYAAKNSGRNSVKLAGRDTLD